MNENYNYIYNDEKSINLVDACLYMLKRWKLMVVAGIVAALIMAAYSGFSSYKAYQMMQNAPEKPAVELTEAELQDFETKMQSIKVYEDNIKAYQTYLDQSIKCKLDPNGFYEGSVNYVITLASDEEVMSAKTICEAEILNAEVYEELAKVLGEDAADSKIGEVIFLSTEKASAGNELLMRLKVTARYFTEDGCQKMLNVLSKTVENVNLVAIRDDVDAFEKLSERILFTSDSSLIDAKQGLLNSKNNANKSLTDTKNSLSENQKKYQNWIETKDSVENTSTEIRKFELEINWIYVFAAAIAGAVCVAGVRGFGYLFGGRIRSKDELESYLRVPVLGLGSGKNFNTPEMIAMMLSGYASANDINNLYLTSSLDEKMEKTAKLLEKLLKEKDVHVQYGESILKDAGAMGQAISCGNVVFLEKCNETLDKNVTDEMTKAAFCGVKVLAVIVEK